MNLEMELYLHHFMVMFYLLVVWLICFLSGDKFLCGLAVLAFTGATWATDLVHYFCYLLLDGSGFCEKECHGDQRKITARN